MINLYKFLLKFILYALWLEVLCVVLGLLFLQEELLIP